MKVQLPFDRTFLSADLPDRRVACVLKTRLDSFVPEASGAELVARALASPLGTPRLEELARGKHRIVLIASDHTRPVPSRLLVPPMLQEIRRGAPSAEITILIATGCHRGTAREELIEKFGEEIVERERIEVHDCADEGRLVSIGRLPSGGELRISRTAAEADLLISEGFIEPHFFAGFSGGRKSVLPGIAARETVYWNHNAPFIADEHARTGILEGNPIQKDMVWAARAAGLAFICNVVINSRHEIVGAFAGDCEAAHREGVRLVSRLCRTEAVPTEIVITTNNGYPLDQNIYQAVKGMSAAEAVCKDGGVIIMAAGCTDGHGGEVFAKTFQQKKTASEILREIESVPPADTVPDQWQSQILARIMSRHTIILISKADPDLVRSMQMIPAASAEEALAEADRILGYEGRITVIPEGVSAICSAVRN